MQSPQPQPARIDVPSVEPDPEPALKPAGEPGVLAVMVVFGLSLLLTLAWVVALVVLASRIL